MIRDRRVRTSSTDFDKVVGMLIVAKHASRVSIFRLRAEELLLVSWQMVAISDELVIRLTALFGVIDCS